MCLGTWQRLHVQTKGRFLLLLISGGMLVLLSRGKLGSCFEYMARVFMESEKYQLECCHSVSVIYVCHHNSDGTSNDNSSYQLESFIVRAHDLIL